MDRVQTPDLRGTLSLESERRQSSKLVPERKLTLLKLVGITCAAVSGGPYGFEDCIGAAGPNLTAIALLMVPFCWSIPMALMTAELSCMIPENGGHVLWVDRAFGTFWSYQNSYWSLFCAVFEGGMYPVMFMDYLSYLVGIGLDVKARVIIGLAVLSIVTTINILGVDSVGTASLLFAVLGLCPFLWMVAAGMRRLDIVSAMQVQRTEPVEWAVFLPVILWNTSGYDSLGACAGEVKNPSINFPKALIFSLSLMILLDVSVLLVGVSVFADYSRWQDGAFVTVGQILGGNYLALMLALGAAISVVGLLCTLLCTSSRVLYGMANVGTVPKCFAAIHTKFQTPYIAMLAMCTCMAVTTFLPFSALAQTEMWFYSLSTILKFLALVRLREIEGDAPRPFRIPVGIRLLKCVVVLPITCCIVLVLFADQRTHLVGCVGIILSTFAYLIGTSRGYGGSAPAASVRSYRKEKETKIGGKLIDVEALGGLTIPRD